MKLSHRIATLNGENVTDDGWSVLYKARELTEAGHELTMLCIGDHDSNTPGFIADAMFDSVRRGDTRYAPIDGKEVLRQAIAKRTEERTGVTTNADNVFVTNGGQGALFSAMIAATDPGQRVTIIDPFYTTYPPTVRSASCTPNIVKADPQTGFQISADALDKGCEGAAALLINTPNNPTGAIYDSQTLDAIRSACLKHDLWLLSDEVYDTQTHGKPHISPRALPDMAERTLVIGSLSKSHVMTGFRIGWLIGPTDLIEAIIGLTNATTYGVSGFIQDAATIALTKGDRAESETAALYTRRRNLAVSVLEGSNSIKVSPPDGAMYVMLDIRSTGLSGKDFAHSLLDTHHIAVMPGESFGQAAAGHIRIALTVDDVKLAEALKTIDRFAQTLKGAA